MKPLPIDISDFEMVINKGCYYIDKTLLIQEIMDSGASVTLIPRPRRFGKTINMTMLRCFFEKNEQSKRHLFGHLNIMQCPDIMAKQGTYPVIFLTFKNVKCLDWEQCYGKIKILIALEYERHSYLLLDDNLKSHEKESFSAIINGSALPQDYENSLFILSHYLHRYHKKQPIILIDEYDAPIHAGFVNKYYNEVINFVRNLLGAALKDNASLDFAVMTGILRIAKESIFSGLNNLEVCTFLNEAYADKFGLTEAEAAQLLQDYNLSHKSDLVRTWYNGYSSGSISVYNPWSLINLAKQKGLMHPYWINTSSNDIIKELIKSGSDSLKEDIELLIAGQPLRKRIEENIVFASVYAQTEAVWNFLLFSGYLTFKNVALEGRMTMADLVIPNEEVLYFYETTILAWFEEGMGSRHYNQMLTYLTIGDLDSFTAIFYDFVAKSFSIFDVSGNEPEKFYHGFVLGMLVSLKNSYTITSNRESGYGRYDVMLMPHDHNKRGIIIEFKKTNQAQHQTLEAAAANALQQIEQRDYTAQLRSHGINTCICLGIAFEGKRTFIKGYSCST